MVSNLIAHINGVFHSCQEFIGVFQGSQGSCLCHGVDLERHAHLVHGGDEFRVAEGVAHAHAS